MERIELNNIYNMDCIDGMKLLEDNSVDLIITDPPYGVGFSKGFNDSKEHIYNNAEKWLREMYRVLKESSHCYIFIPIKEAGLWITLISEIFTLYNILSTRTYTQNMYLKNNFSFNNQLVVYCSKGTAKRLNKVDFVKTSESWFKDKRNKNPHEYTYQYPAFLDMFSNEKTTSKSNNKSGRHPCSKNVDFIEKLVLLSSNENDIVLEPFVGGGSTCIAALNTNRRFIGFELSEEYYNLAIDRIKQHTED